MIHLLLHFLIPGVVVALFFRNRWKFIYCLMILTMLVDLDHLIATPIYNPERCSIGFHPLHQPWFVMLYFVLCFLPKTRVLGIGLTIHMMLDAIDCQVTNGIWIS